MGKRLFPFSDQLTILIQTRLLTSSLSLSLSQHNTPLNYQTTDLLRFVVDQLHI